MRLGVDATGWTLPRGFGRHLRGLLSALVRLEGAPATTLVVDSEEAEAAIDLPVELRRVATSRPTVAGASARDRRRPRDLVRVARALADRGFDVLLLPSVYSFVPVWSRARQLLIVHDTLAEDYPDLTLATRSSRWAWRLKSALARRFADRFITISEVSRRRIVARWKLPSEAVRVISLAPDELFRLRDVPASSPRLRSLGFDADRPFLVYLGGFSPHKNLPGLFEAVARLGPEPELAAARLYLVGQREEETFFSCYQELVERASRDDLRDRVVFTGFLPDEEVAVLLHHARALVLASVAEGFGLPAVEAAACGCPVVATRESPLPELLGEAGLWIDPRSPEELEIALRRVLTDAELRASMSRAGPAATAELTWERSARQLLELLHEMEVRSA